jgi:hypothetical protein
MIISRIAILLSLLSLLIALYGGSRLVPALLKSGVVFVVAFAVMFILQITVMNAYRKAKESEYSEAQESNTKKQ